MFKLFFIFLVCIVCLACSQNSKLGNLNTQNGALIYFMHEAYFFPIPDTSLGKIANSKCIGFKLGKIELNSIYDSISHKHNVQIYISHNGKLDTLKSSVGLLLVSIKTKSTTTMLSPDSNAFGFEYNFQNLLFNYQFRFDKEVMSINPLLNSDRNLFRSMLKKIEKSEIRGNTEAFNLYF